MSITYTYKGLDQLGKGVQGEILAEDARSAISQLKAQAIFPTAVTPSEGKVVRAAEGGFFSRRNLTADVSVLTRQLASLVGGGVPMMAAFAALTANTENLQLRLILNGIQEEVRGGAALWEAMQPHQQVFSPLYVNMVKAGEASGQLQTVLNWLADYQEKEQARRTQIRGALAYPMFLLIAGTIAVLALMTFVVPKFAAMFEEFGQALPLSTVVILTAGRFLAKWGWAIALGIAMAVLLFRRYAKTPTGRVHVDALRLHLPLFGKLGIKAAMSRFARTTATLLQGGVPLLDALTVVRDVLDNEVLARATDRAREGMREGERFAARLRETGAFPPFITHMIGIGEETGDLRNMLETVASTYDVEVEATLKAVVSVIEPTIIITIGGLMGFIILSMLMPVFQISLPGS